MAAGTVFDFVAEKLEQATDLDKLEARGTVRLALKQAGLDAATVMAAQMEVVLAKVLPRELEARGVADPVAVCAEIAGTLSGFQGGAADASSPEAIFERLGGLGG